MKRLLTAALALSLMGGAAAVAQDRHDDHRGGDRHDDRGYGGDRGHDDHRGGGGRHWRAHERLDNRYGAYQEVGDWRAHRLAPPRRGYHWVRSGDDYVQAALVGGLIASVVAASR